LEAFSAAIEQLGDLIAQLAQSFIGERFERRLFWYHRYAAYSLR
jgi:hypothetical protein